MANLRILVADDDRSLARVLQIQLGQFDYEVYTVYNGKECLEELQKNSYDLTILDLNMPVKNGIEVLQTISSNMPCPVIVLTAYEDLEMAVRSVKLGAFDYLTKPFEKDKLIHTIEMAIEQWRLDRENENLKARLFEKEHVDYVPIQDSALQGIIKRSARSDEVILIHGETGTGKEYLARYIHAISKRSESPFLALNCAAIPESLLESTLFGHVCGAFTGAANDHDGLLHDVANGTLFLDEIGDMPLSLQAKLLRVLEDGSYRRLGDNQERVFRGRLLSASHRDIEEMAKTGEFREDLLYRLNTIPIPLPPLRERIDEIELYLNQFVPDLNLQSSALTHLKQRRWSGNIRELRNYCARMRVFIEGDKVSRKQLLQVEALLSKKDTNSRFVLPDEGLDVEKLIDDLLIQALNRCGQNQTRAGKLLGLSRQQVIHRMRKWNR